MYSKIFYLLLLCNCLVSSSIAMDDKHFNQCYFNISKQYKEELQDKQQVNTNNINKNIDKFEIINKNYKQEIDNSTKFKTTYSSFKQQIDKNNKQNNNKDKTNSKQIEKFKLTKEYFEEQTRIICNNEDLTPDKLIRNCSFLEYQNKYYNNIKKQYILGAQDLIPPRDRSNSVYDLDKEDSISLTIPEYSSDDNEYAINTTCTHDNTTQYKSIISDKSNKN